jgi:DNA-binding CsgD family transcriptional regulator
MFSHTPTEQPINQPRGFAKMHDDDQLRNQQTHDDSRIGRAAARVVSRAAGRRASSSTVDDGADSVLNALGACEMDLTVNLLWSVDALAGRNVARDVIDLERRGLVSISSTHVVSLTAPGRRQAALLDHVDRARLRSSVGHAGAVTGSVPPRLVARLLIDGLVVEPDSDVLPRLVDDAERHLREGRHDDARDVLNEVVAAIEFGHPLSDRTRLRAYLRLSLVLRWAGDMDEAERVACRVLDVAQLGADPIDLAIASLVWRPTDHTVGSPTPAGLIDAALLVVDPDHEWLLAMLLASRAELAHVADPCAARSSATEALRLARRVDDPDTFIRAASVYLAALPHPGHHPESLALANEMVAAAPGAIDGREGGAIARLRVFFELGDFAHFDSDLNALWRRIERRPRPFDLMCAHLMTAARAHTRGEWATARTHGESARVLATRCGYATERQLLADQQAIGAWQRGDSFPEVLTVDTLGGRSIAAVTSGDVQHARLLFDGVAPLSGYWASAGGAVDCGPYDYHLGTLAALLGRRAEAVAFTNGALATCVEHGCAPWEARARLAIAQLASDDIDRRNQATRALALADRLGMTPVADDARVLLTSIENPAGLTDREIEVLMLMVAGGTNRRIADDLALSVKTIERHLLNAYRKIGAINRAEASAFAAQHLKSFIDADAST